MKRDIDTKILLSLIAIDCDETVKRHRYAFVSLAAPGLSASAVAISAYLDLTSRVLNCYTPRGRNSSTGLT